VNKLEFVIALIQIAKDYIILRRKLNCVIQIHFVPRSRKKASRLYIPTRKCCTEE